MTDAFSIPVATNRHQSTPVENRQYSHHVRLALPFLRVYSRPFVVKKKPSSQRFQLGGPVAGAREQDAVHGAGDGAAKESAQEGSYCPFVQNDLADERSTRKRTHALNRPPTAPFCRACPPWEWQTIAP